MKRLTLKSLGAALAIALAGAAIAVVIWVVATTHGTRWFLTAITPLSGVGFSAQVEGRIMDHLLLSEVRLSRARQRLEIDRLELRWRPLRLLAGTVAVQELTINGMRIQDDAPRDDKPPTLAWPRVPRTGQLFEGKIALLRVTNISYRRLQEQPVRVTSFAGAVAWQDGLLSISQLKAVSPSGQVNGSVSARARRPGRPR